MKAYIIRLKEINLSKTIADECIQQAAKFNICVQEFDAINGLKSQEHIDQLNLRPAKKIKPGACGCILSHIYLWKKCVEDNEPYLVLEHDGYILEPLPDDILDRFDNVLKLDNNNPYSKFYEDKILEDSEKSLEIINLEDSPKFYSGAGLYSRGSYAYIIKPQAAKLFINWIEINGFIRSDHQLGNNVCRIQTVNKTIVRLHPFYHNRIKSLSLTDNIGELNGIS